MSLIQFLRILNARRAIILVAVLSCFLVALVMSQVIPERYQGKSRIMLEMFKPDPVTGQIMNMQLMRAFMRTQIELIEDYRTAGRVVDQLGWANDPGFIAQYSAAGSPGGDIRRFLAQRIIDGTSADLLQGSNILEITYSSSTPEAAKRVADLVRASYMEESLRFRRQSASTTADWYREQTDKAQRLLIGAEGARNKYAKDNGIVLQSDNVDVESAKLQALSQQSAMVQGVSGGGMIAGANPASMQLEMLDQQIAQAATTLGPNHPGFQSLQRQRAALAANASRGGSVSMPSGPNPLAVARAFEVQKGRVLAERDKIDRLNQMQREVDLRRDQYLRSAQRAADLRMEADIGEVGLTPLGDASASDTPSFPNVPLIILGSIGFGLALGLCVALITEFLSRRIRSDDDLASASSAPVFAIIGNRRGPDDLVSRFIRLVDRRARTREEPAEAMA